MKKRSLFGLFFTVVLSLLAISCSFNATAGLSFSLSIPSQYRSTNDETVSEKTADIIVYNSRTMNVVQKETFTTTTDSLNVTLEYLPVGQGLFVYARVTATVSDEQGNSRIVAWSGKSDVFSLEAGMVENISMRVSKSTFVEFYCTGIPDKATIGANGITTVVIQEDDASAVSWYVTITIAYEDGRVITAPIVNVGNLYIALNDEVKYNAYVDSCLGASVTIKCYSIDSYQFDALAEPISETHLAETIESIVSSGPKYYGTTNYSTPTERIVISMHE